MQFKASTMFKAIRILFGAFMILVYFGMAYLLFVNFFKWNTEPWLSLRYVFAIVLVLYGIYRCYRQIKGSDYYRLRDMEERFSKYNQTQENHENK